MPYKKESATVKTLETKQESDEEKEVKAENESLHFDKADFEFIPKGDCQYRQQGPYLICYSCELQHAVWIGMEKQMVGMNENGPIIVKRDFKQG